MAKKEEGTNAPAEELTVTETPDTGAETPKPKPEETQPTREELQAQLAEKDANYKAVQRNLETARQQGQSTAGMQAQIDEILQNQALTFDYLEAQRQGGDLGEVSATPGTSHLERYKAQRASEDKMRQTAMSVHQQVGQMMQDAGIDPNDPALDPARQAMNAGEFDKVIPEATKAISKAVKDRGEKTEQDLDAKAELLAAKKLQDMGLLDIDTGQPTAAPSGSDSELRAKYAAGEITTEAYSKECKSRGIKP